MNALSIKGWQELRKEKEKTDKNKLAQQNVFLEEPFTYDDLLIQWNKYKERLEAKGFMLVSSIMGISELVLEGTTIKYEVPNQTSKTDMESEMPNLLGYLKGHLKNHHIKIEVSINENIQAKKTSSKQDVFLHMAEKNPALELLRKTFDLDI